MTLTLAPFPQKTSSFTTPQVIWERPSSAIGQDSHPGLNFSRWLGLQLRLRVQQTQQHTVPPRGAAETTEGRGGRHRPETCKDPHQINRNLLLACSPACQSACLCGLVSQRNSDGDGMERCNPCLQWTYKNVVWFMYKGYCVTEQEVATAKEVWLCSILECCSLPYARLKLPLEVFECLSCSLPHQRETGGNIWAFGEGGTSQEWSVLCVDFTVQKQKGKVHFITCFSLCSFSEKEASSSCGVMNNRFIHMGSGTSVFLCPFYRLVLTSFLLFPLC